MAPAFLDLEAPNGVKYSQPTGLFINNEFVESASGGTITSIDPAYVLPFHVPLLHVSLIATLNTRQFRTEKPIATVQAAGPEDVDRAVKAAHKALKDDSWKLLPGSDRGTLMFRLADLMEQKKELFATIDAWDNGKYSPSALCSS